MISVEQASVHFGGLKAVDNISFEFESGRITGLIGPNGAGKSTIFNAIAGHVPLNSGKIYLSGQAIEHLPSHERAFMGLSRTFQIPQEFSRLTVIENLMVAALSPAGENIFNAILNRKRFLAEERENYENAREMIDFLEIGNVMDEQAGNLSGGQKKLLELGRSLMNQPKIVLLDEIGAGINRTLLSKISDKILKLNQKDGLTFCLIEHDLDYVSKLCDHVIVMAQGKLLAAGDIETIRQDKRVIDAYFGGGKYETQS